MGWASGSQLAEDVWAVVREYIPEEERKATASRLIRLFEDFDCDTLDEAEKLMADAALPENNGEVDL